MSALFCLVCKTKNELTKHHIMPKAAGGLNSKNNLVVLCQICHTLVERYYWEFLANLKPACGAYYIAIIKALRENIIPATSFPEADKRLKLARTELLNIDPKQWPIVFKEACAWINTVQITKIVKMTTHNFILEEPWWIQK